MASVLIILFYLFNYSLQSSQIVHDKIEAPRKDDERSAFRSSSSLPDWSDIKVSKHFYVELLLAVDAAVLRYYGHDQEKVISALTSLMHAVNMYAHKLNIHIIVVDIVPVRGYNVSLEQFLEWRQETPNLASHDVAMLIRHRYEGGIAYVDGICKRTSVGLCGFFPEAPYEYASVFFHELAHLFGLSHDMTTDCVCSKKNKKNCLRIDGFEKDCSAQALVNLLPQASCLSYPTDPLPRTTLSICGNGVVEDEEDCDCGPEGQCVNIFCDVRSCRFVVDRKYLYSTFTFGCAAFIFSLIIIIKRIACTSNQNSNLPPSPLIDKMQTLPKLRTETEITVLTNSQLPSLGPIRQAPKRPPIITLDTPIPISHTNDIYNSEYVKMNPIKSSKFENENFRLPMINPSLSCPSSTLKIQLENIRLDKKPEISKPIALIVQSKSMEDFLESFDESSKTLRLHKKSIDDDRISKTLPRPPVPDRKTKPLLASLSQINLGDCPNPSYKRNLYDLPPL